MGSTVFIQMANTGSYWSVDMQIKARASESLFGVNLTSKLQADVDSMVIELYAHPFN